MASHMNDDHNSRKIAIRTIVSVLERFHAPSLICAIMEIILDYAVEAAEEDVGSILIADEESDAFKLVAIRGDVRHLQRLEYHYPVDHGVQQRVLRTATHYFMPNVHVKREYVALWDGIESELCLPLMHHSACIGVLNLQFLYAWRI